MLMRRVSRQKLKLFRALAVFIGLCLASTSLLPAVAVACEGESTEGVLQPETSHFVEHVSRRNGYTQNFVYHRNNGPRETGPLILTVRPINGAFTIGSDSCTGSSLENGGTCSIELRCNNGPNMATGTAAVRGNELGIRWWEASLECVEP
jgi:hypothetical protein